MSEEHNFGFGLVPAHKHPNGGGWVANTAHVRADVYLGPEAQVFDQAWVFGQARVSGGYLRSDISKKHNGLTFQRGFFTLTLNDGVLIGGCHTKTPDEWLTFLTPEQTKADGMPAWALADYRSFVKFAKILMEEKK